MKDQAKQQRRYLFSIIGCFIVGIFCFVVAFTENPSTVVFICCLLGGCLAALFIVFYSFLSFSLSRRNYQARR
jgi:hypothetical protein